MNSYRQSFLAVADECLRKGNIKTKKGPYTAILPQRPDLYLTERGTRKSRGREIFFVINTRRNESASQGRCCCSEPQLAGSNLLTAYMESWLTAPHRPSRRFQCRKKFWNPQDNLSYHSTYWSTALSIGLHDRKLRGSWVFKFKKNENGENCLSCGLCTSSYDNTVHAAGVRTPRAEPPRRVRVERVVASRTRFCCDLRVMRWCMIDVWYDCQWVSHTWETLRCGWLRCGCIANGVQGDLVG